MLNTRNIFDLIHKNEIASRFAKVFSVDVFVKGASFLLLPVYLHLMTQDEVGTFNYLFAFIQVFSIVLNFGLYTSQSKLYHDYFGEERGQMLFSINFVLVLFLILTLLPIYCLKLDVRLVDFLFEYPIPYHEYRWPLLLALLTSVATFMLFNYLLTSENIKRVQLYNLLRLFVSNGFVIAILYFSEGDKVWLRLITYYSCEAVLWIIFVGSYVKKFIPVIHPEKLKKILSFSFPVFLLSILSTIQGFSDKFFVQQKTDMSVLAVYTLGITIASVCSLVIQSFQNIWLPVFFKEKNVKENFRKTQKMVKYVVIVFSGIAILMIGGVKIALIYHVIPVVYEKVLIILPFLFVSQIILAVNALFGNYFIYFERVKLGAIVGGSMYTVSFALNYILIPRYGVTGAVIALLLGNILLVTVVYSAVKRLYHHNKDSEHENIDYSVVVPE